MDANALATVALFGSPVASIVVAVIANRVMRKGQQESTSIASFEANIQAYDKRAESAEKRLAAMEEKFEEQGKEITQLQHNDQIRARQLARIKIVVQDWFRELRAAWPLDTPMPMPPDEDMELLEITVPGRKVG
jgi:predicted RNase H-like nuclease (RuvC/YqgF family)